MSVYRLLQSVANTHNILLLIAIIAFVYVSFLPSQVLENKEAFVQKEEVPQQPTCIPTIISQECVVPDLKPYDHLVSNYERLKGDFEVMRSSMEGEFSQKLVEIQRAISAAKQVEDTLKSTLQSLEDRQVVIADRVEKVQRRIAVPRNTTVVEEKIVEISGSCPLFYIENAPEYRDLLAKLESSKESVAQLNSQFDALKQKNDASQRWLVQLSTALPIIKQRVSSMPTQTTPVDVTSVDLLEGKVAALVQNEVHDQWKAAKVSHDTFAELYRISTETFDTITERWQSDIQATKKQANQNKPPKEKKGKKLPKHQNLNPRAESLVVPPANEQQANIKAQTPAIDFALFSAGATVVTSETSETFVGAIAPNPGVLGFLSHKMSKSFLGGSPEDALSPTMVRGSCWPMQGSQGNLTVALAHPVEVQAITLDHLLDVKDKTSAPRTFHVFTKEDRSPNTNWEKVLSWEEFDAARGKVTYHIPTSKQRIASHVRLEIVENYGHPDYTCIYRFRVHGKTA